MMHRLFRKFISDPAPVEAPPLPAAADEGPAIEELEARRLPAADITSLIASPGAAAPDPIISGHVEGDPIAGVRLEFDSNADGTADGSVLLTPTGGDFSIDLRDVDPTLDEFEGTLAVRARPVELDSQGAEVAAGEWVSTEVFVFGPPPTISDFGGSEGANDTWTFTGTAGGPHAAGATIEFGGVLAGNSVQADSSGNFTFTAYLGTVDGTATAKVVDSLGQESDAADFYCNSIPDPVISDFCGWEEADDYWTFTGTVSGPTAGGATIQFGGVLSSFSTTADSTGHFTATFQLGNVDGTATAQAIDCDGRVSTEVEFYCTSEPDAPTPEPWQISFSGTEGTDDYWTFNGTVAGSGYEGAMITFGGVLCGYSATVDAWGCFSLNACLGNVDGLASASVVDPTGQTVEADFYCLSQPDPEPLVISSFSAALLEGLEDYWQFSGSVSGTYAIGASVTLGGMLSGVTATVVADGSFSVSATLSGSGTVTAVAEGGGMQSNVAEYYVVT